MSHSVIAAIDLGSNSFRLEVARVVNGQLYTLDALKETIRLAAGLKEDKTLDHTSQQRALNCLKRFSERIRGLPAGAVRVVGTNTLRVAKNATQFLRQAEAILGVPIEIIAGHEEARLIYIGVSHFLPRSNEKRLVVDIGGGSTEFIIGQRYRPLVVESLYMGCVTYSSRFFPEAKVSHKAFKQAELAAATECQVLKKQFGGHQWQVAVGSSGTAKALTELLEQNGFPAGLITRKGLEFLKERLIAAGDTYNLKLPGLKSDRIPVLAGGLAIMLSIFKELAITEMVTTDCGLREGVLYEMLGRIEHQEDIRVTTVNEFAQRYHTDSAQALRVKQLALKLFKQLVDKENYQRYALYLGWAAQLHEIGLSIAHAGYHRHAAYIIDNADMPGFSKQEQAIVGGLLQAQRGRLTKVQPRVTNDIGWSMILALRLAVLIHRDRRQLSEPIMRLSPNTKGYALTISARWLQHNPLSAANLTIESEHWSELGKSLVVRNK
ncbi:exopolyphosphatase [Ferrovum sp. PN-J185]|uniref:exopolyphosphatase n=1 Tax=Ferrovum sp. PN-J185 TaxID=1356306 RepID=UPI000796F799|nr:exopolyphosphatase [Ferrovum sp. PN-J185]KXW56174.1 exopolyphosphatase [Ferrovum sp. PN-J185]MCC6067764.1 exopolyphosphatase [Ferrovum sp. PN-J185]MDE1892218.1 exopolyphosphatase [Betaproteobacteria bacterium]MDE2056816.1 exopolyphosphatase [Betaproteobacteria bacterium]